MKSTYFTLFAILGISASTKLHAQETVSAAPFDLPLYAGAPAGAVPLSDVAESYYEKAGDPIKRVDHVQTPDIRVFLPPKEKNTGAACVICPGGGYSILAIDHEGWQIAKKLNEWGVAGIVVKYRVSKIKPGLYPFPIPQLDVRQAIRLTRQNAEKWGIKSDRIGVLGFSAGGHLASTAATLWQEKIPGEEDAVFQTMQHQPNWAALIYAVTLMGEEAGHRGSMNNLLGAEPTEELVKLMNTPAQVSPKTPPTFLVTTHEDKAVPTRNATAFYDAMHKHNVPGELHSWEKGPHGFGILEDRGGRAAVEWPELLKKWLEGRGLLSK